MIEFHNNTEVKVDLGEEYTEWIKNIIVEEGCTLGDICFVLGSDEELLTINSKYLQHDYYTDVITFDYSNGKFLNGDIYISLDRVIDNSTTYEIDYLTEMRRVMIHGVLHLSGYKDSTPEEKKLIRAKENSALEMFHVKQ